MALAPFIGSARRALGVRAGLLALFISGCAATGYGELPLEIVGGSDTDISKVPYQVALVDGVGQFCGGSILNQGWVITAGHCVGKFDAGKISVLAGVTKLSEAAQGQRVGIVQVFHVPGFVDPTKGKDVALVRLQKPLDLSGPHAKA